MNSSFSVQEVLTLSSEALNECQFPGRPVADQTIVHVGDADVLDNVAGINYNETMYHHVPEDVDIYEDYSADDIFAKTPDVETLNPFSLKIKGCTGKFNTVRINMVVCDSMWLDADFFLLWVPFL